MEEFKYYKNPETGEVFAYLLDGSQDEFISESLVLMTDEEVAEHIKPKVDYVALEIEWRDAEMLLIADQLLRIEDADPTALPGTDRQWRDYRIKVRAWVDGAVGYPDSEYRPKRPV